MSAVETIWTNLCARRRASLARGYDKVSHQMDVENNLLTRQAAPMLKTNGSAVARELYSDNFLSTITGIPFRGDNSKVPFGVAYVTVRTRFAGLVRPVGARTQPPVQSPLES